MESGSTYDDGEMLTDSWVDDEYYVGDDGAMLINTWKKTLADEDMDDPEDDGEVIRWIFKIKILKKGKAWKRLCPLNLIVSL